MYVARRGDALSECERERGDPGLVRGDHDWDSWDTLVECLRGDKGRSVSNRRRARLLRFRLIPRAADPKVSSNASDEKDAAEGEGGE